MSRTRTDLAANDHTFPILFGERGSLTLAVYNGTDAPARPGAQYAQLAYGTLANSTAMLRHFDFDKILRSENLVVFVSREGDLMAAAYVHPETRGDRRVLVHKGYVSSGQERGLARVMIAALHVADAHWSGAAVDGEAVARVLRDGAINEASSTPFADAGFHGVRNYWDRIGRADVHLEPFAEQWPDGFWVGCHLMAGKAQKIAARAADILADWTLSWGPERRSGETAAAATGEAT